MLPMKNKPYKGLSLAPLPPAFDLCPIQSLVPTTHPPSQEGFEEVAERLVRGTGLILSTSSRLRHELEETRRSNRGTQHVNTSTWMERVAVLEEYCSLGEHLLPQMGNDFAYLLHAVAEADRREIGCQIGLLIGAFPNFNAGDPEVYINGLIHDVAFLRPSRIGLEVTCRNLRRTSRFVPVIAEVLQALRHEHSKWNGKAQEIVQMPRRVAEARELASRIRQALQHQVGTLASTALMPPPIDSGLPEL